MIRPPIVQVLRDVTKEYKRLGMDFEAHIPRISFEMGLAVSALRSSIDESGIVDIGGGVGLFAVGCAALGFRRSVLVDDFGDGLLSERDVAALELHQRFGVEILRRDVTVEGIDDLDGIDVFASFNSIEHWHRSPKSLFHSMSGKLPLGGVMLLGTPNCVNLRKRITVPFGVGKWSSMEDWYDTEYFRGHVREPDVDDLRYIARDLKLENVHIYGRNWLGYYSRYALAKWGTHVFDRALRLWPSLCSDIYMIGNRS